MVLSIIIIKLNNEIKLVNDENNNNNKHPSVIEM